MEGTEEEGAWVRSCRIFVGGLGEAVTESDLERTFSSLGEVKGVEVVRTKGRTFAYLNFLLFSNKSMGKLFSMIEKAKEHYIVRLKREWEEDASVLKEDSSLLANKALLERSKKGSSEQMQLHVCFPKLRKKSRTIIWSGFVASLEGSMDDIGNEARKVAVQSHVGMGSLDVNSEHELFEDESLVSPDAISRKSHSLQINQNSSFSIDNSPWANQRMIIRFFNSIRIVMFSTKINLLLPFGPLAILVHFLSGNQGWVFLLSLIGIIPLAERLGYATEQLAFFTGATVGGLLNATFGNATELIISIYALKKGMLRVVQQSLLGSILSNMLLVLGCAFLSGGIVFYGKEQSFNKANAVVNSGLLLMAVMGLLFPAVLHYTHTELHYGKSELALSRFSSCIMLFAYACFLFFQLQSQKNLYSPVEEVGDQASTDDEVPEISKWESIVWLGIITAWISVLSEYLVDAIEGASSAWKMPMAFISVILLPIVGNAAEHASAVMFAMKDKLDISLGVAIGSSTQISMFGIPFCVVIGWIMGRPMDLNFQLFETATLFVTVLVVAFLVQEGTSNYFKGLMLVLSYLIVAASFYVHVDPKSVADKINAR